MLDAPPRRGITAPCFRLRDTSRAMSQDNVEIVRKCMKAFLENDFDGWFATTGPGCKLYPRFAEQDAHADGSWRAPSA